MSNKSCFSIPRGGNAYCLTTNTPCLFPATSSAHVVVNTTDPHKTMCDVYVDNTKTSTNRCHYDTTNDTTNEWTLTMKTDNGHILNCDKNSCEFIP